MKCVAVCQDDFVVKTLHQALAPALQVKFVVEDRALARRLHDAGIPLILSDPRRVDTYLQAEVTPTTCVIIEDNGRRSIRRILQAVKEAGGVLVYALSVDDLSSKRDENWGLMFPEVTSLSIADLLKGSLQASLGRSLTRARVQQYQRYFTHADRVLILLHDDPDPDALASGLALRNLLHRTKTTAIIGAFQGMTRPENIRMASLLDIHVKPVTQKTLAEFDRIATVDVQPHYFGGLLNRVDLVIDHHPEREGYTTMFKDIRVDYGSTATILTEHLRSVDANISERIATAMLYAIKSDTLFLSRQTDQTDLEAFTFLYPLANAVLVRKMEGAEITLERIQHVTRAVQSGLIKDQVFTAHIGRVSREDLISYAAEFLLQLEDVKWSIVSGIVDDDLIVSVRNLGYSRNAGEFVKKWFNDIGSAGGHRAMAKAVVPIEAFHKKFSKLDGKGIARLIRKLTTQFLQDYPGGEHQRVPGRTVRQTTNS